MANRKQISKSTRFEIFKRDSFTCQYCGRKAPDVLLVIDHIKPVAKGGANDFLNLITACKDCNAGKSDRQLSDSTTLEKQRQQLEDLQERKEQIAMMFQWQKGLLNLDDQVIQQLTIFWTEQVPGFSLNENGIKDLKRFKRKFKIEEIMAAMRIAAEQYLEFEGGKPIHESVEAAWKKVGGICVVRQEEKKRPHMQKLRYIRGILRNRLSYLDEDRALQLLEEAFDAKASLESLEKHAKSVRTWTEWRDGIESFIQEEQDDSDKSGEGQQMVGGDSETRAEASTASRGTQS